MAGSYNRVVLLGNLTRDPELRYTPQGTAVTDLGLAVNRVSGRGAERKEETTFVDVTVWDRRAEICCEYLTKGRAVLIEGRLHLDQWEDRETGQKRSKLKVIASDVQFVGGREGGGGGGGGGGGSRSGGEGGGGFRSSGGSRPSGGGDGGFDDDFGGGDDIPF